MTTKLHLLGDQRCRALAVVVSGGEVHDSKMVDAVLDSVRVPRPGKGRPRRRPNRTLGDKGYSYPSCRAVFRERGIEVMIPERSDQRERRKAKGRAGGRPRCFDRAVYRNRNVVERCFLRLKQWRRVATRYDKNVSCYQAWITLANIIIWLRT